MIDGGTLTGLLRAYALKDESRTGWSLRGIDRPESVAAHSWGVAFLAWRLCPDDLDRERVLELALVHDLAEAEIGDIPLRTPEGNQPIERTDKARREAAAIAGPLGAIGDSLEARWAEYEARETPEATFVKDLDHLDACLQAILYRDQGAEGLDEFFETARAAITTDVATAVLDRLQERYDRGNDGAVGRT